MCARLVGEFPNSVKRIVTVTTRKPRPGETDGQDYHFWERGEFLNKADEGAFVEHELIHDNYYGTLKSSVLGEIERQDGCDLLLNVDVNGASSLRELARGNQSLREVLFTVFVNPSSIEQLRERLLSRGSDAREEIEKRLRAAGSEIERSGQFDFVLPSVGKEEDYAMLRNLYLRCSLSGRAKPD